jgi:hypothetical protein
MIVRKLFLSGVYLLAFPFFIVAQNLGGNPAALKWQQINTNSARVIFPKGLDSQANRINNIVQLLDNTTLNTIGSRRRKWNIVLLNQTTISNAYVRLAPVISEFYLTPDQNNFSTGSLRADDNLVIHENRHMQQFANFNNGLTKVFSFFLGQEGQLLANGLTIPDYFFEGDAVWQETLVSTQGRGRMASFFNGIKSLTLGNKKYSWMKLRSGSLKDYTPDHYELGYQLIAYGNEKYGQDFWRKVTKDAVHFKGLFYPFNKAIERYSGKTYPAFREDALAYFRQQTILHNSEKSELSYITGIKKNTVADYLFPAFVSDDTIIVTKKSYKEVNAFYLLVKGKEKKIRIKNLVLDDYFSYCNGKVVYAAYQSDPRWANKDYSNIQLLDIYSNKQQQLTFKSKYFSPDINADGTEVIAVNTQPNGANHLHRINVQTGELVLQIPNPNNYFFTQTKYLDSNMAVSAVRNPEGQMALVKVDLTTGQTEAITPFSFYIIGFPCIKGDTVYYSKMDTGVPADKIFAVTLKDKKIYRLTNNVNGIYQPAVSDKGTLLFSAFTADGSRIAGLQHWQIQWTLADTANSILKITGAGNTTGKAGAGVLYSLKDEKNSVTKYKKSFQLFNFHSWRPFANDPEYGYTFYSDNILSSFSNNVSYTYNRNERSHRLGFNGVFAGWFPLLGLGAEESFNRHIDTAAGKQIEFNSAKINASISVPLSFVGGRTSKYVNFGSGYNIEKIFFRGNDKNIFNGEAIKYTSSFFYFSNASRLAKQQINPRWAQSISINYKNEINLRKSHKLVTSGSLYFPGLFANHSLVINGAYQKRDTFPDLFSNNFSYSRGYEALTTRQMYKVGINYHLPVLYPDWGFGNMVFFQRIRANAFYDYTNATARLNGTLTNIKNRSTGGELYFDTKLWNALPASFGIRFSHLFDTDIINPGVKNRWEIIVPIGLIPN